MRMRELEQRTGVNRETVRYYIREGLLPEPARMGKTSATYTEAHVVQIKAIRRLQDERHLPLAIIKALLNSGDGETSVAATAFPNLEADIFARVQKRNSGAECLQDLSARVDTPLEDLQRLIDIGFIRTSTDSRGDVWVRGADIAIAEHCAALRLAGFTAERGFAPELFKFYLEFVDWLASEEMRLFLTNMAGHLNTGEAANAAERGIDIVNEILALLRTRTLLEKLHDVNSNPHHNDNP